MSAALEELEAAIGYAFKDQELLRRALTHASHSYEAGAEVSAGNNEQLEFLGDAILGFLTSDYLIGRYPSYREGQLSKIKNYLVSASYLHEVAQRLGLGRHLLLGRGEELSGGREKQGLLADALEALLAAIHLDGGLEAARDFVTRCVLADADKLGANLADYKGALQEEARARHLPQPQYRYTEKGPAHERRFTAEVSLGEWVAQAEGRSKKRAGQQAARELLAKISQWG